jgi:hypothetical protein
MQADARRRLHDMEMLANKRVRSTRRGRNAQEHLLEGWRSFAERLEIERREYRLPILEGAEFPRRNRSLFVTAFQELCQLHAERDRTLRGAQTA